MRRFKKVKEKKVTYSMDEWAEVERRAALMNIKTGTYIRAISVEGQVNFFDIPNYIATMNAMRSIANNLNQIARKANEINSIYLDDIKKIRSENEELGHLLAMFFCNIRSQRI